jgi:cysteine desulfurase
LVYLDNNSTTPIDPRVLESMIPYFSVEFANASSSHKFGLIVNEAVKKSRKQVAELINCEINEIIFTSGATEAINLAIKGISESYSYKGKHIITVSTEHTAVLDVCKYLETIGFEITFLSVQRDGIISLDELKNSIRSDTILVTVMIGNNETGVIQPIREISEISHNSGAFFMTDGTQAVGKIPVDVNEFHIDLMSLSGHKIYGPKGVGALFIKQRNPGKIKLNPLIHGGGHERGFRSGTLNVPGIIGLGKACEIAMNEMDRDSKRIMEMRDYLEHSLLEIEDTFVNGNRQHRLYNTSNICFRNADSEAVIIGLEDIAVSNGSACTSISIEPSHVLKAMGLLDEDAFSSLRFSLGRLNKKEEIKILSSEVCKIVNELRTLI